MDQLLKLFGVAELSTLKFAILIHHYPDTDALLSAWTVIKLVIGRLFPKAECKVVFVPAGPIDESVLQELADKGYNAIPMDVGRGVFDQHGKGMRRGSSFELVVDYFQLWAEPGIAHLVNLARATDNIEDVDPTSIHHSFSSMASQCRKENREIDWDKFLEVCFLNVSGLHGSWRNKEANRKLWVKMADRLMKRLRNGVLIGQLSNFSHLRDSAYKAGADCVVFFDTEHFKVDTTKTEVSAEHAHCVIISLNRKYRLNPHISLHELIAALRAKEAGKRGEDVSGIDLTKPEIVPKCSAWFLLGEELEKGRVESGNVILCGSRSHPIVKPEEITWLTRREIYETVREVLGRWKWVREKRHTQKPAEKPTTANKKTEVEKKTVELKSAAKTKAAPKKAAKPKRVSKKALASEALANGFAEKGWKVAPTKAKKKAQTKKKQ